MWLNNNIHILRTTGDYIFSAWVEEDYDNYRHTIHKLRCDGYRKVETRHDSLNTYELYRKRGKKRIITITVQEC